MKWYPLFNTVNRQSHEAAEEWMETLRIKAAEGKNK